MSMVVTLLAMVIIFYPPISKIIKVVFGGFFNGIGKVVFVILIIIGFLVTGPIGWVISTFLFLVFYGIKHYWFEFNYAISIIIEIYVMLISHQDLSLDGLFF